MSNNQMGPRGPIDVALGKLKGMKFPKRNREDSSKLTAAAISGKYGVEQERVRGENTVAEHLVKHATRTAAAQQDSKIRIRERSHLATLAQPGTRTTLSDGSGSNAEWTVIKPTPIRNSSSAGSAAPRVRADGSHLPKRYQQQYRAATPAQKRALNQKHFYGKM